MKNIELYVPKIEDYWYEQKLQRDPYTMSYNAGYDVKYLGYDYNTGCIEFPKERWEDVYNSRNKKDKYFAYVKDNIINQFVGYVNYNYNSNYKRYDCGIVIEYKYRGKGYSKRALELLCYEAKKNNIKELYDNFEKDRENTLKIFKAVGFEIVENQIWNKFDNEVEGVLVKIIL
ncbi:MAG: GNAT family N-acetyltransferase [Clostridia bacterium]|nr:GNAT family N-acetyltransferase [Clostridia bacterium]